MSNRCIIKRSYYDIDIELASPLNVGGGILDITDADVMRSSNGECFIPGTSLAGAFRNFIGDIKSEDSPFGFSKGEDGKMSSVIISDMYFDADTIRLAVRDRVSLSDDKDVNNKFDIEVIESGAKGRIRIETVLRDGDDNMDALISDIIIALNEGDIRLGAVKNRGFGRVNVEQVRMSSFDAESREQWINYMSGDESEAGSWQSYETWRNGRLASKQRYIKFSVPLKLTGGISIRKYSTQPGKADFEHITSNNVPVIPGTSWNGAVRADAKQILKDTGLKETEAEKLIEKWFGKVKEKKSGSSLDQKNSSGQKESWASKIVISESVIEGARPLVMTRNNINRFTAGTKVGALYTERSFVGGTTVFEYMIPEGEKSEYKALKGIMKLVVNDLCNGLVAVGGQVAVGRGIFEGTSVEIDAEDEDLKALYQEIQGMKGRHK